MENKKYWFISYAWRRHSGESWEIENNVIDEDPFDYLMEAYDSNDEVYRFIFYCEISEDQYNKTKDKLS